MLPKQERDLPRRCWLSRGNPFATKGAGNYGPPGGGVVLSPCRVQRIGGRGGKVQAGIGDQASMGVERGSAAGSAGSRDHFRSRWGVWRAYFSSGISISCQKKSYAQSGANGPLASEFDPLQDGVRGRLLPGAAAPADAGTGARLIPATTALSEGYRPKLDREPGRATTPGSTRRDRQGSCGPRRAR